LPDDTAARYHREVTVVSNSSAAILVMVLTLLPAALERCRTACVEHSRPAATTAAAHTCHDTASDEGSGVRLDPVPGACGHSEAGRAFESAGLRSLKIRAGISAMAALAPTPVVAPATVPAVTRVAPPGVPRPSSLLSTLNSPLRL